MTASTRLTGRRLKLARLAWLATALVYGLLLVLSTPAALAPEKGEAFVVRSFPDWSEPQIRQSFAELGLSLPAFAAFGMWSDVLLGPLYYALGLFLFWRRSDDWLALLVSATFIVFLSTGSISGAFGASPLTLWLDNLSNAAVSVVGLLPFFLFPDGRFVPRWMRWVVLAGAGVQVWRVFFPEAYSSWALPLALPTFIGIAASLLYRYFRVAGPVQRQQIKWVVFSLAATTLPLAAFVTTIALVPTASQPGAAGLAFFLVGMLVWWSLLLLWPAGLIISILRYRLWDIDVIIRRTLVYSALTALLALAYLGSVLVLQGLAGPLLGEASNPLATVASTLSIVVLFGPLRGRVQAAIDRRFYRRKVDAARTLAAFAATARDETDLATLSGQLIRVVDETMQPAHTALWLQPAPKRRLAPAGPRGEDAS